VCSHQMTRYPSTSVHVPVINHQQVDVMYNITGIGCHAGGREKSNVGEETAVNLSRICLTNRNILERFLVMMVA